MIGGGGGAFPLPTQPETPTATTVSMRAISTLFIGNPLWLPNALVALSGYMQCDFWSILGNSGHSELNFGALMASQLRAGKESLPAPLHCRRAIRLSRNDWLSGANRASVWQPR